MIYSWKLTLVRQLFPRTTRVSNILPFHHTQNTGADDVHNIMSHNNLKKSHVCHSLQQK